MKIVQPLNQLISSLWGHFEVRRRWQFAELLFLMIIASFAEFLSIGAVIPFLGALTSPEKIFQMSLFQPLILYFSLSSPNQLLLPITVVFGLASGLAAIFRLTLLWASTRLSFGAGGDISLNIYNRTLYQPYVVHINRNSSEVIDGITTKTSGVIFGIIFPLLSLISSSMMIFAILLLLLLVDPINSIIAFSGFGIIYLVIIKITRKRLLANGRLIAHESTQVIKSLQEGLGGIRDVLIDGSQSIYRDIYQDSDMTLRRAQGNNLFVSQCPRYGVEALGMVLIATLAYFLASQSNDGVGKAIPILGVIALGAQRLLPLLQQSYAAWSSVIGNQQLLQDTVNLLSQPLPESLDDKVLQINFFKSIDLSNLSYRYNEKSQWIFRNIDLYIERGSCIGFIGKTGSGKSTLLDIIMGLLDPTEGVFKIDGIEITHKNIKSWQKHISHVPQYIYLADSTLEENIAFGVSKEKIDNERVVNAAKRAQISSLIESWPLKYKTLIGERGVKLSGGQRQRIGIARALYKQETDVIIFDEATSALDTKTEEDVMNSIEALKGKQTILIIAHRLSTLKYCTKIVQLEDGRINKIGNYDDFTTNE